MKKLLLIMTSLVMIIILTGCGRSSEKQLIKSLPDTITSYYMDDMIYLQEVEDLEIVKRNTEGKHDDVECVITLKDDYIERTVYAELYLTKYDEGWMVDSWDPTEEEIVAPLQGPSQELVDDYLLGLGFENFTLESENTESLDFGEYYAYYNIKDSFKYATFTGTASYYADLSYESADGYDYANISWNDEVDTSNVDVEWKVLGKWKATEQNPTSRYPDYYSINIKSVDNGGNINATAKYYYPNYNWDIDALDGTYNEVNLSSIHAKNGLNYPSSAKLDVYLSGASGNYVGEFHFTPNETIDKEYSWANLLCATHFKTTRE